MTSDAILMSLFPQFPGDSITLTLQLPAQIYLRGDDAAVGQKTDVVEAPQPVQRAVEGLLDRGRPILLGAEGQFLGSWLGQVLGVAQQRAGIGDATGVGLKQVPFADMMAAAVVALRQFLVNNPAIAPMVPVDMDELVAKTAVLLFRDYLVAIMTRGLGAFTRGQVQSQNEVAALLDKAWEVVAPLMQSSLSAHYTLEPLRAFKQAGSDKAKESRRGREEAHSRGVAEGQQAERDRQETAARPPTPVTPTVLVQPAPASPVTRAATTSPSSPKRRRSGKRG